jgi:hypothetical protein
MYIDPRVAHGRAKLILSEEFVDVDRHVGDENLTVRQYRGMLISHVGPALRREGYVVFDYSAPDEKDWLYALVMIADLTHGMRGVIVTGSRFGSRLGFVHGDYLSISPHAIARCLQRNGTLSMASIRSELECAVGIGLFMAILAEEHDWKQVYLPTEHGLFVGEFVNG